MRLDQKLEKADLILCLGSHDTATVDRAIELYKSGYAPLILFSGGFGRITSGASVSEAEKYSQIAISEGIPEAAILIEPGSKSTGENVQFSEELIKQQKVSAETIILVHKPYMERRTLATFEAQWANKQTKFYVTSIDQTFDSYCRNRLKNEVISIMVGDLQRIKEYPDSGFQTYQEIPSEVWSAYEALVDRGYTDHLIKSK